jgi:hypothetical protein
MRDLGVTEATPSLGDEYVRRSAWTGALIRLGGLAALLCLVGLAQVRRGEFGEAIGFLLVGSASATLLFWVSRRTGADR